MNIVLYRSGSTVTTLKAEESSYYSEKIKNERLINVTVKTNAAIDARINDYITWQGEIFYINTMPAAVKSSSWNFEYTFIFESIQYELAKVLYMLNGETDFYLFGNTTTFINLIVANLNRVGSGWTVGTVTDADNRNLQFLPKDNCLTAINKLSTEYNIEFYITGSKVINFAPKGVVKSYTFQYGKGNGLYIIKRSTPQSKNMVTRLFAYGSDKNIPSTYRSGAKRLRFENAGVNYLEKNVLAYGVIEDTQIFDEVFPTRTGTLSAVDATHLILTDSSMNFDVNSYLLPSIKPKLHFESGDLAGYDFEFTYDNANKQFTITSFIDEQGTSFPNASLYPKATDTYKLIDIQLPQSYIDTAEALLKTKAQAYLDANCNPYVSYTVECDPILFKTNSVSFGCGDYVTIVDTDLGVNKSIRVLSVKINLYNPYKYDIELSDVVLQPMENVQKLNRMQGKINKGKIGDIGALRDALTAKFKTETSLENANEALGKINNLKVGLRSLIRYSDIGAYDSYAMTRTNGQSDPFGGTNAIKLVSSNDNAYYRNSLSIGAMLDSKDYTFGVWLKASSEIGILIGCAFNSQYANITVTTTWQFFNIVMPATTRQYKLMNGVDMVDNGATLYMYQPTLVEGNQLDGTIAAPEDVEKQLSDMASDSKLTPLEKQAINREWLTIVGEKSLIDACADNYGNTTEKAAYGSAYNTLSAYITPLLADLTATSAITSATFDANFKDYYNKKESLLNAINNRAKALADTAQSTINSLGSRNFITSAKTVGDSYSITRTNGQSDPFGGNEAYSLVSSASNGYNRAYPLSLDDSKAYTFGVWLKVNTGTASINIGMPYNSQGTYVTVTTTWQFFKIAMPAATRAYKDRCGLDYIGTGFTLYVYQPTLVEGLVLNNTIKAEEDTRIAIDAAMQEAASATAITDNFVTIADGVATGNVMMVGTEATGINAGMSGLGKVSGSSLESPVRFFAGDSYGNRESADWICTDEGVHQFLVPNSVKMTISIGGIKMYKWDSTSSTWIEVFSMRTSSSKQGAMNNFKGLCLANTLGVWKSLYGEDGIYYVNDEYYKYSITKWGSNEGLYFDDDKFNLRGLPTRLKLRCISHTDITSPEDGEIIIDTYQDGNVLSYYYDGAWRVM